MNNKIWENARRHLMTGVSYMIPFVVSGGLLLTIGILIGGGKVIPGMSKTLVDMGVTAFQMMVPIMAGYMAYSMADRPGIAPGIVGGLIANKIGAGFLGGIVAGFIAGWIVNQLKKIPMHPYIAALKPIIIIPFFGVAIVSGLMLIIGQPISALSKTMEAWLNSMTGANAALLGFIIAAMMAFDMGGPVNKIAFAFSAGMLSQGVYAPMAACWVGIMAPPIGLALATYLAPKKFTEMEKKNAIPAAIMGATGITEGAIPYAAADPLRVIPSLVIGSGFGGAVALLLGAQAPVPSGGVFVIPFFIKPLMFVIGFAAAIIVTAVITVALKKEITEEENNFEGLNLE
ncbi:PTS fructose transporter subunit IIC [Thermosediminibacter litoriperuensis]|uniref:PTS system fructose-specific IIC component/fructose-specific PTS system IIC-like component n=1 Tax=Thermosediminibacter litoriperuensis TaxID=291989 RepID=A0A5S5AVJ0_9FIRM|nr:PTS fructose transporter subunit IIC [Thermosediminibacter litoriperuensis]TYP55440.1 PTS system fructose-specific IIC component/fructose-specific PTS system IIC-like component [Thermosediminibacter litoriperuensis]